MITCSECNFSNASDSQFCEHCGKPLHESKNFIPIDLIPIRKKRPLVFSVVLFLNYLGILFLIVLAIDILFMSKDVYTGNFVEISKTGVVVYNYLILVYTNLCTIVPYSFRYAISLIGFAIAIIWIKFVISLKDYNNKSRRALSIIIGLSFFYALAPFNLSSLLISGFILYVLDYHRNTVNLFTYSDQKKGIPS